MAKRARRFNPFPSLRRIRPQSPRKPGRDLPAWDRIGNTRFCSSRVWLVHRAVFLHENPLCADCYAIGRIRDATEVHHKIARRYDREKILDRANFMALCKPCHSARTARGE